MLPASQEIQFTPNPTSLEVFKLKRNLTTELERGEGINSSVLFGETRRLNQLNHTAAERGRLTQYLREVGDQDYLKKAGLVKEVYAYTVAAAQKKDRNGVLEGISLFKALGYEGSEPVDEFVEKLSAKFYIRPNERYVYTETAPPKKNPLKSLKTKVALAAAAATSLLTTTGAPQQIMQDERPVAVSAAETRFDAPTPITETQTQTQENAPTIVPVIKTPTPRVASPTPAKKETTPAPPKKEEAPLPSNLFKDVLFPNFLNLADKRRAEMSKNPELAKSINPELKNQYNFILLGIGSDGAFTDSMIVLSFNKQSKQMSMINIPRDMQDPRVWKLTQQDEESRINAAYIYGGLDLVDQVVADATGLFPDASLVLRYDMIDHVVDAMGGLEIYLPEEVYDPNIHFYPNGMDKQGVPLHFTAGQHKLTGFEARRLIQSRRGTLTTTSGEVKNSSDYIRAGRQQEVIKAILVQLQKMLKEDPRKFIMTMNTLREFVGNGYSTGKIDSNFDPEDILPSLFDPKNIFSLIGVLKSGNFELGVPMPQKQLVFGEHNVIVGNVKPNSGAWVSGTGKNINLPSVEYYTPTRVATSGFLGVEPETKEANENKVFFVPGYMQKSSEVTGGFIAPEVGAEESPDPKIYMQKLKESILKEASSAPIDLVGYSMGAGALEMFFESGEYDKLPQSVKDNIKGIVLIAPRDIGDPNISRYPKGLQTFYSTEYRNLEKMRTSGKPIKVVISKNDQQVPNAESIRVAQKLNVFPILIEGGHSAAIDNPEILKGILKS